MQQTEAGQRQLPAYKSHKTVWALKIAQVVPKENPDPTGNSAAASYGARIVPADEGYAPFDVPAEYVTKHNPQVGGYYVLYADGYASFSPAQAFEEGYIALGDFGTCTKAETGIEAEIRAVGANVAPRITPADIEANIDSEHYFTAADGVLAAGINSPSDPIPNIPLPLGLLTFCVLVMRNGFTVTGQSACASPENFNAVIGRRIAREDAVRQVWPLLGYELRSQLSKAARRHDPFAQWKPKA